MADTNTPDAPQSDAPGGDPTAQCSTRRTGWCRLLPLSMVLSLLLHVAAMAAVVHMAAHWRSPDLASIYTVDLVTPEESGQEQEKPPEPTPPPPAPTPKPPEPTPTQTPPAPQTAPRAAAPKAPPPVQPSPSPAPKATPTPPAGHGPRLVEPGLPETAETAPGVTAISPVTPPVPSPKEQLSGPDLPGVVVTDRDVQVGGLTGFAGQADTFRLEQVGADVFTEEEYTGLYRTRDGSCIDLVDARKSEGALILHWPRGPGHKGMVRCLTRYGKMIYTHGPGFRQAGSVAGTIYLLPKKARYNNENIDVPNQLMWMPPKPPMLYAEKVRIRERDLPFESGGTMFEGFMAWTGHGPNPAVVLAFGGCPPRSVLQATARRYALYGLTVLAFAPRGCDKAEADRGAALPGRLTDDLLAAVAALRDEPESDAGRVGVVGLGAGAVLALKAAADPSVAFAAMTCPTGQAAPDRCGLPVPRVADLLRAKAPLRWLLPPGGSGQTGRWDPLLERLRQAGLPDDAAILLPDPVPEGADADEARWLRLLDHAPARATTAWADSAP